MSSTRSTRRRADGPDTPQPGDPATRRRICEAALKLIARRGDLDVPLSDVARASRVSRQALYLHFANRADLLLAVVRYADEKRGLPDAIARISQASGGVDALEQLVAMQAEQNPEIWPLARVVDSVRRQDPSAERAWHDRMAGRLEGCRAIVTWLQRDGVLRDSLEVESAAELVWTLTSLRTWEDLVLTRGWTAEQYRARVTDWLLAALTQGDGRPPTKARQRSRPRSRARVKTM